MFTRRGDTAIEVDKLVREGKQLETCLIESIKASSTQKPFKDNRNIILYVCENGLRTTLAVENKVM